MLAHLPTPKLHTVPPEKPGARTFVAASLFAPCSVARHEETEPHPLSRRGRAAVIVRSCSAGRFASATNKVATVFSCLTSLVR
jgi:hypothetical protein